MDHYHATHQFAKLSEFDVDLFGRKQNTIGRPEPPERSEPLGNWESLGAAVWNVLLAMGRP